MTASQPLTIEIPQSDLDDLRERLARTRWPADPGNPESRYGAPRGYIEELLNYWRDQYDWRVVEAQMNTYDHQLVDIDGIPIHFMRIPGQGPNPTPIVLTHGWPWTFWDFCKVIDPLADTRCRAYKIIAHHTGGRTRLNGHASLMWLDPFC